MEYVTLEISGSGRLNCKKRELVENSEYFRTMFNGNFVERNRQIVKLQDVEFKALQQILSALRSDTYTIPDEDLLPVLQASCMLLFLRIKNICIDRLLQILEPKNCLKIWFTTEQLSISPLYLKAKSMALQDFSEIRQTDAILELNLQQIRNYLGHIYLNADSEHEVFSTAFKWWDENKQFHQNDELRDFIQLLLCINFTQVSNLDIEQLLRCPTADLNAEVVDILKCLLAIRKKNSTKRFKEPIRNTASVLNKGKDRKAPLVACFLEKRTECRSETMEAGHDNGSRREKQPKSDYMVTYYDGEPSGKPLLFAIDRQKLSGLDGFGVVGYKRFVCIFGGEYSLGKGKWNHNFWMYDTLKERWCNEFRMPFVRRHFETCLVEDDLYIVGGTGQYRCKQNNMYYYNFKSGQWSDCIDFPFKDRQVKCCVFRKFRIFILCIGDKRGYIYDKALPSKWSRIKIPGDVNISNSLEFDIVGQNAALYIQDDDKLREYGYFGENNLRSLREFEVYHSTFDKMEILMHNSTIGTFYEKETGYSYDTHNLNTGKQTFYLSFPKHSSEDEQQEAKRYETRVLNLLSCYHYSLVNHNRYVVM